MSGCGCKSDNTSERPAGEFNINDTFSNYGLKILAFLIALLTLPFIMVMIIYIMFNTLVMNKDVDMKPLLMMIGDKFKKNEDDDDDDYEDLDELTEDDVVVYGVEQIERR